MIHFLSSLPSVQLTPEASPPQIIEQIRHSATIIPELPPKLKVAAITSYAVALRTVFICQAACSILAVLCCIPIQENPLPCVFHLVIPDRRALNEPPSLEPPWRSKTGCFETDKMDKTKTIKMDRIPRRLLARMRACKPPNSGRLKLPSASLSRFSIVFIMFLLPSHRLTVFVSSNAYHFRDAHPLRVSSFEAMNYASE